MPVVSVDCRRDGTCAGMGDLRRGLDRMPDAAPVVVMVHGYKWDPAVPARSPHGAIFAPDPVDGVSWPAGLGATHRTPRAPLAVGFGWPARGSIWTAWRAAEAAGAGLAQLLDAIAAHRGTPAHLMAHSLGVRVVLQAARHARAGRMGRALLLTGAALRSEAEAALRTPAGRQAEFVNVTTRENDLFDALLEGCIRRGATLGGGLGAPAGRWLDLQIDDDVVRDALGELGYPVAAPDGRISHWSAYRRAGVFALYRALLEDPRRLPLALLRAQFPDAPQPRWSRLVAWPAPGSAAAG